LQHSGGEDQENLQVADTEEMNVEQLAEQLENLWPGVHRWPGVHSITSSHTCTSLSACI